MSELVDLVEVQRDEGLTGAIVLADFLRSRVHPLAQRHNYAFEFLGSKDSSRSSPRDLSDSQIQIMLQNLLAEPQLGACSKARYWAQLPPSEVSTVFFRQGTFSLTYHFEVV